MAEFHAHRIRPSRIAYRMGIDIAFIEELIAGESEAGRFERLVLHYRKQRYAQRMQKSKQKQGIVQYELQQRIEQDYQQEIDL